MRTLMKTEAWVCPAWQSLKLFRFPQDTELPVISPLPGRSDISRDLDILKEGSPQLWSQALFFDAGCRVSQMPVESTGGLVKTGIARPWLVWMYSWACISDKFPDTADAAGPGTLPWTTQLWNILEASKTLTICHNSAKCPVPSPSLDLAKRLCNQISLRGQLLWKYKGS